MYLRDFKKHGLLWVFAALLMLGLVQCTSEAAAEPAPRMLRTEVIVDRGVFQVSYNEQYEQPNWVIYPVRSVPKNVDRAGMNFYTDKDIHTSDDADYYANPWDKGHMAPAADFSDSSANLTATFSYLNCALQLDNLNRGEWAALEAAVRSWADEGAQITVKDEPIFEPGHLVLPTGAHVPSGFWKHVTFGDGSKKCYYFPNETPTQNWTEYQRACQE